MGVAAAVPHLEPPQNNDVYCCCPVDCVDKIMENLHMQMSLTEIIPLVRQLPPLDRLRLIRILAEGLTQTSYDDISPLEPYKVYELHTPYDAFGVADQLREL